MHSRHEFPDLWYLTFYNGQATLAWTLIILGWSTDMLSLLQGQSWRITATVGEPIVVLSFCMLIFWHVLISLCNSGVVMSKAWKTAVHQRVKRTLLQVDNHHLEVLCHVEPWWSSLISRRMPGWQLDRFSSCDGQINQSFPWSLPLESAIVDPPKRLGHKVHQLWSSKVLVR